MTSVHFEVLRAPLVASAALERRGGVEGGARLPFGGKVHLRAHEVAVGVARDGHPAVGAARIRLERVLVEG